MAKIRSGHYQFGLFFGAGVVATGVHYLVLVTLVSLAGVNPVVATCCGYVAGAFTSYFVNYKVTFRSKQAHGETMIKFASVAMVGFLINTLIVWVGVNLIHLHYVAAQLIATALVFGVNFALNKHWTFKEHKNG
ncbi:MAG TPA: GtrA family protein [Telluria sp.]